MAKLFQDIDKPKLFMGWYGTCAGEDTQNECVNHQLVGGTGSGSHKIYPQINAVYEVRSDGFGQYSYNGTLADGSMQVYQQIKELKCGHCYLIVLKKGSGFIDINHFVPANENSANYRLVSSCEIESDEPTPTPDAQPTPTPKAQPTPTPQAQPTPTPQAQPTPTPQAQPTPTPQAQPTPTPQAQPTPTPQAQPTPTPKMVNWKLVGEQISEEKGGNYGGYSVAMNESGNTIAIGSIYASEGKSRNGQVRVFTYQNSTWIKKGQDIAGDSSGDFFGIKISMCATGNTVAVSSPRATKSGKNKAGYTKIYTFQNNNWIQKGETIEGTTIGQGMGSSVYLSASGNVVAIGSRDSSSGSKGRVFVYKFNEGNWQSVGNVIVGSSLGDRFGFALSLNARGNILAVGTPYDDVNSKKNAGSVSIYQLSNGRWVKYKTINGKNEWDYFGQDVSLDKSGFTLAVGTGYTDDPKNSGTAVVFKYHDKEWKQIGQTIKGTTPNSMSGRYIDLSGDGKTLVVASPSFSGNKEYTGVVRIYNLNGTRWEKIGLDIKSEKQGDIFSSDVAINHNGTKVICSQIPLMYKVVNNETKRFLDNTRKSKTSVYEISNESVQTETPTPTPKPTNETDENYIEIVFSGGNSRKQITLPLSRIGDGGVSVNWGDETANYTKEQQGLVVKTFPNWTNDDKTIRIFGDLHHFGTNRVGFIREQSVKSIKVVGMSSLKFGMYMFSSLRSDSGNVQIDLSKFDSSNITRMDYMFSYLNNVSLDLSNLNTESAKFMNGLFLNCKNLKTLDLSNWNTQNCEKMNGMFYGCTSLSNLLTSNWNTQNVVKMDKMFYGCRTLKDNGVNFTTWCVFNIKSEPTHWSAFSMLTEKPAWGRDCSLTQRTKLIVEANPGDTSLQIPSTDQYAFQIDDEIIIDRGTVNQETNRVVGYGSLLLDSPLVNYHSVDAIVETIGNTSQPTPTPVQTPTPVPQPTPTPEAQPTPTPEAQPTPTPEAQPTPTPTPEPTPTPTPEAQPTPTPQSTVTDGCISNNITVTSDNGIYKFGDLEYTNPFQLSVGSYSMDIPEDHPMLLENVGFDENNKPHIEILGGTEYMGNFGTGRWGSVKINVYSDFGIVSYKCARHGYMGGQDNLQFNSSCPSGDDISMSNVCEEANSTESVIIRSNTSSEPIDSKAGVNGVGTEGTLCFTPPDQSTVLQPTSYLISLGENYEFGGVNVTIAGTLINKKIGFIKDEDGSEWIGELELIGVPNIFTKFN